MVGNAWHQRTFPYPLLASWTGDYEGCDFGIDDSQVTLRSGAEIEVMLQFRLTSDYLADLIESDDAGYAVAVSCPKTFTQTTYRLEGDAPSLLLRAADYSEEIYITPYIVSLTALDGFSSKEHMREWLLYRPDGFTVPEAGILAVGNIVRVTVEEVGVHSVIDLVADSNVVKGLFHVELGYERIKIHVEPGDKESIEALRRRKARDTGYEGLFASLYLSAVAEALREMPQYEHTRWAFAMRIALERHGVSGPNIAESIEGQELRYAQMILENPMSGFLEAAINREDEE